MTGSKTGPEGRGRFGNSLGEDPASELTGASGEKDVITATWPGLELPRTSRAVATGLPGLTQQVPGADGTAFAPALPPGTT